MAVAATASTVAPLSFKDLSERARRVAVGRIERISSYEDGATGRILSRVEIAQSGSIPEGSGGILTFEMTGGTVGDRFQWIAGFPKLAVGDQVVLFLLEDTATPLGPTVGLWQGVFFVDAAGAMLNHRRQPLVEFRGDQVVAQESGTPPRRLLLPEFVSRVSALRVSGGAARR